MDELVFNYDAHQRIVTTCDADEYPEGVIGVIYSVDAIQQHDGTYLAIYTVMMEDGELAYMAEREFTADS